MRLNAVVGFGAVLGLAQVVLASSPEGLRLAPAASGIEFRYALGAHSLRAATGRGAVTPYAPVEVRASGLRSSVDPGLPALPAESFFVALPPGASARLVIEEATSHEESGVWVDPPATSPVEPDVDGEREYRSLPDAEVYATDGFVPAAPVAISSRGIARDVDFAQIELRPFLWNPVKGVLRVYDSLRFRVEFDGGEAPADPAGPGTGGRLRGRPGRSASPAADASSAPAEVTREGGMFVNPVPAAWHVRRAANGLAQAQASENPAAGQESYKIEVDTDGLYRVSFESLVAVGLAPSPVSFADLRLQLRGATVPMAAIDRDGDGKFSSGDALEFYGLANPDRWTGRHVYWLTRSGGGQWMRPVTAYPREAAAWPPVASATATLHAERQELLFSFPGVDPDEWNPWVYSYSLIAGDPTGNCGEYEPPMDVDLTLRSLAAPDPTKVYQLRGQLLGRKVGSCNPDAQQVDLSVNGTPVGSAAWKVSEEGTLKSFAFPIDPARLTEGTNRVELFEPPLGDTLRWAHLDWLEVDYPKRLVAENGMLEARGMWTGGAVLHAAGFTTGLVEAIDLRGDGTVDRLLNPKLLTLGTGKPITVVVAVAPGSSSHHVVISENARVRVPLWISRDTPSNLRDPAIHADYLAIAHPDFVAATQELVDYRASQGHSARVVDVQDVYDEFSWGNVDAHAIYDFLAYGYSKWAEAPRFVVLVGDSSEDFRNYYGVARSALYLPHLEYLAVGGGATYGELLATDSRFQTLSGPDAIPDLLLGRISAQSAADVSGYVAKVKKYEASASGEWNGRYLVVVDDDLIYNVPVTCPEPQEADSEKFAVATSDCYLAASGPNADLERILVRTEHTQSTQKIIDQLNQGVGLTYYMGHGAIRNLGTVACSNPLAVILSETDISRLTNPEALPLGVSMSCNVAAFAWQDTSGLNRSFSETYVLARDRGDIAFIGSVTKISDPGGRGEEQAILDGLFRANSSFLPDFVPDSRRLAGAIHFAGQMGFLSNPIQLDARLREWESRTLALQGDPALRLHIDDPASPPQASCPVW